MTTAEQSEADYKFREMTNQELSEYMDCGEPNCDFCPGLVVELDRRDKLDPNWRDG